jgi:hypothetical protein
MSAYFKHKLLAGVISYYILCAIGFYNEADTLKSSSILIYSHSMQCFFIHKVNGWDATVIKALIK